MAEYLRIVHLSKAICSVPWGDDRAFLAGLSNIVAAHCSQAHRIISLSCQSSLFSYPNHLVTMSISVQRQRFNDGAQKEMDVGVSSTSDTPSTLSQERLDRTKAIRRKVDTKILLWYSFVYLIMRINVSNISNTAIMNVEQGDGIKHQLGNLKSAQWAWVLSIFYYPYMLAEPASTLLLKRFKPRVWMSRIMITWGIVSMCQAATQNYAGILAARFFLGLAEVRDRPLCLHCSHAWKLTTAVGGFLSGCAISSQLLVSG